MCSDNLINITVDILEQQIRNRNALCLVLDCRPFLAFNESHILNSINIHCPPILRRRKNGHLTLRTIIPDNLTRERLSTKYFNTVILYDEFSLNDQLSKSIGLTDDSMINVVAKCLQQEADLKNVYVLDGGIQKFRQAYPHYCTAKETFRNGNLNKSPILGNLTWPLKSNNSNGLPNGGNLKICCFNSVNASQTYLSGTSKYQILSNNNSNNCAKTTQLTCNNNVIINNNTKNFLNTSTSSSEDNNENILMTTNNTTIDTIDSASINNHLHINHHSQQPLNHLNSLNNHQIINHHFEQSATNQQQFNNHQLINNQLTGSCSQLNQLNINQSNTNLLTNHSMSLSNLTNLSNFSNNKNQILIINENHHQCNQKQCNHCLENNNNLIKFNSFGNDVSEPVEILPHLLLGSELHASQLNMLKRIGVTALLNVSHSCPNHFEKDFIYKCIPVQDSSFEDISVYFDDAIQFIDQIKENNGRVLVHCHAGISRSATICMAYIMANKKLRMDDAYEFVKNRRRIVSPNFNFMGQLLSFESIVFSKQQQKTNQKTNDQMETDLIENKTVKILNQNDNLISTDQLNELNELNQLNENGNCYTTNTSQQLKNIFDFSANYNSAPDFNSIKLNSTNITTPTLLSPT